VRACSTVAARTGSVDPIHEKLERTGPLGRLSGDLLQRSRSKDWADYLQNRNQYTDLQTERMFAAGQAFQVVVKMLGSRWPAS